MTDCELPVLADRGVENAHTRSQGTRVLAARKSDPTDAAQMYHGGPFASVELGHSGVASMNIVNDKKEI